MATTIDRLPFTGDDEADRLLVEEPLALLIGFALDQQVTVQKAFSGPAELKRRLGHLDAARIAATDPATLDALFRERPALHRFPGSMTGKVQQLAAAVASFDTEAVDPKACVRNAERFSLERFRARLPREVALAVDGERDHERGLPRRAPRASRRGLARPLR